MGTSIATTKGDSGQTGLAGGVRVSKASLDGEIAELSQRIQRDRSRAW